MWFRFYSNIRRSFILTWYFKIQVAPLHVSHLWFFVCFWFSPLKSKHKTLKTSVQFIVSESDAYRPRDLFLCKYMWMQSAWTRICMFACYYFSNLIGIGIILECLGETFNEICFSPLWFVWKKKHLSSDFCSFNKKKKAKIWFKRLNCL